MFEELADLRKKWIEENGIQPSEFDPAVTTIKIWKAFLLCNLGQIQESESISSYHLSSLRNSEQRQVLSVCLHNLGVTDSFKGDYDDGLRILEEAIVIGRDSRFILWPTYLLWLGHVNFLLGEYEQGLLSLEKCRDVFLRVQNYWGAGFTITKMGLASDGMGNHLRAMDYHQKAIDIFIRTENQAGQAYSLSRMSMSACFLSKYGDALKFGQEAYEKFEEIRHRWGMSCTLTRIGLAYLGLGEIKKAEEVLVKALRLSRSDQMAPLSLYAMAGIACMRYKAGDIRRGMDLMGVVMRHPKTPHAYLDSAISLLDAADQKQLRWSEARHDDIGEDPSLAQVVDEILAISSPESFETPHISGGDL
jgi:tetratricopeptide (TPR) repeat protein